MDALPELAHPYEARAGHFALNETAAAAAAALPSTVEETQYNRTNKIFHKHIITQLYANLKHIRITHNVLLTFVPL